MAEPDDYVSRARARILEVLAAEHAVVHPELEARISEAGHAGDTENIDPHHVTTALRELRETGEIEWVQERTKGGFELITIQSAATRLRQTKIATAAKRKRALLARYNGWSQGSRRYPHGVIGPAGEEAVRRAIWESGTIRRAAPRGGPVSELLGVRLLGELDTAGYLIAVDSHGIPQAPVTVPVEVKNLRSWIYPQAPELFQLLGKAQLLQAAQPDQPIVPVFACRKVHPTTYWMAQQLGFMAISMGIQFAGDVPDEEEVYEVRSELHFQDLARGSGPSLRVRDRLQKTLPNNAHDIAAQWAATCANDDMANTLRQLRTARHSKHDDLVASLRHLNTEMGRRGGW